MTEIVVDHVADGERIFDRHRAALVRVLESGIGAVASCLGVRISRLRLVLASAEPGDERMWTDYAETIVFELSSPEQLSPPPRGHRCIYAACHELAHLAVARRLSPDARLPVVWDEAVAHFTATRCCLPALWHDHGPGLWPDPYPDYVAVEGSLDEWGGAGHFGGYVPSLKLLDRQLDYVYGHLGWEGLVGGLAGLRPSDRRPERLGPALLRLTRSSAV